MTEIAPATRYSLLLESDLNRVYTGSLGAVAATELRLVADGLFGEDNLGEIDGVVDGRSQQLRFTTPIAVDALATTVGQLSASAALFRHRDGGLLEPVPIDETLRFGSELVTTQRYRGKTSERLTRAMLNVGLAAAGIDIGAPSGRVLDPMCGRGTTLNWALAYGLDAVGVDVDRPAVEQHASFVETWAKRERLPHRVVRGKQTNAEHRVATIVVAPDRPALKSGTGVTIETFAADGGDRSLAIKRDSIDVIVTDLPYGVQHRGSGGPEPGSDTVGLLEAVVGTWRRWLRPGGAVCLAWNTKRAGRRDVGRALADGGLTPVTVPGTSMRHTVDSTIDRDVIVAVAGGGRRG